MAIATTSNRALDNPVERPVVASSPARPARAAGLELLGELTGSGYRQRPCLARRADGQTIQLTPLVYGVLEAVDGHRDHAAIASVVSEQTGRVVEPGDIEYLIENKLRPLGVLRPIDGVEQVLPKSNPLLGLRCRVVVSNPEVTDRITAPFARLFRPPIIVAFLAAFLASTGWLMFDKGLAAPARAVLYDPGLLLVVFTLTLISAGFHELGHAAACRYGGATPGVMGAGLYLVSPAFYTDVSDSYRLDRRGRLRVDVGGLYFNAIFAVGAFALWAVTGWDALLVVIPLQVLQMLRQLGPFVRLDGYHILADLTGVPDLFARVKPVLLGLLPWRWGRPEAKTLRPWARFVVTAWVLIVVPILILTLLMMVVALPAIVATAWDSLEIQATAVGGSWANADLTGIAVGCLSILALVVPVLSVGYLLVRIVRRTAGRVWAATEGRSVARAVVVAVALALAALLASAWWPQGQYEPIRDSDRWTVIDGFQTLGYSVPAVAEPVELRPGAEVVSASREPSEPNLATGEAGTAEAPWLSLGFPFNMPEPPGEGDNQALAVNTGDGTTVFDFVYSFILVSAGMADPVNEAYALASCRACTTMAVAFQVVLVLGDIDVAAPENIAVAVNSACLRCATMALAIQLFVTLDGPLTDETAAQLQQIWEQVASLEAQLGTMPLTQLQVELAAIEAQILDVLVDAGATSTSQSSQSTDGEPALASTTTTGVETTTTTDAPTTTVTEPTDTTSSTESPPTTEAPEGS